MLATSAKTSAPASRSGFATGAGEPTEVILDLAKTSHADLIATSRRYREVLGQLEAVAS